MDPATDRVVRRGAATVALAALLVVIVTIVSVANPVTRTWLRARLTTPGFVIGASSQLPTSLYRDHARTVLIFVSAHCDACMRAQPFHRALTQLASAESNVSVQVLLTTAADDPAAYAAAMHVPASFVASFDPRDTRLKRVPTILVVDRAGVVLEMTEGVLSDEDQHALVKRLTSARPTG